MWNILWTNQIGKRKETIWWPEGIKDHPEKNNSNIEDTPHLFGEGKKPVKKNKMRVRGTGKRNHFGKIQNRVKSIDQVEE